MALSLKIKPKTLTLNLNPNRSLRPFSSSSSPPDDSNGGDGNKPPPPPSYSSLFSDIRERLKSPPSPPRRIPSDSSPHFYAPKSEPKSLSDIRKHLAEFHHKSPNPNPNPQLSFQDLVLNKSDPTRSAGGGGGGPSFDSIRNSLRRPGFSPRENSRTPFSINAFKKTLLPDRGTLPEKIFGPELREKTNEGEAKRMSTEFVKMYSHEELGEKLRKLRPATAAKGKKNWFSLEELNTRLVKLREMEEKEMNERAGGDMFRDLRDSLVRLKDADVAKKNSMQNLSILANIGISATPAFMLKPPQEELLENVSV